jgi:hypothetical protein
VPTLVERGGNARSFCIDKATIRNVKPILYANIARESALMTDASAGYTGVEQGFISHKRVNHQDDEYVLGDVHTKTIEGFFSIFKRMKGVYQHCARHHLHRYLAEFDSRCNERKL